MPPHASKSNDRAIVLQEFLTDSDAAAMLGVTTRTMLRWRSDGDGPKYVRLGVRRLAYRRGDIMAWAADRTYCHRAAEHVARAAQFVECAA